MRSNKRGRTQRIDAGVFQRLIHALADADHRGLVEHDVDTVESFVEAFLVANVRLNELRFRVEIIRSRLMMDLRFEIS